MSDAHREWHRNTGVPMGQPGCPQDACHPIDEDYHGPQAEPTPELEMADADGRITCPACGGSGDYYSNPTDHPAGETVALCIPCEGTGRIPTVLLDEAFGDALDA